VSRCVPAAQIDERINWRDITPGGEIYEGGTALLVNTGEWRTMVPFFLAEKCKHCMLCVPVCPDASIPVKNGKRLDFDFKHCKGCGVCYKVCPFGAITFGKEEK
jgi:pyruvate ferredoxin oxidoreductase delta subunit